MTSERFSGSIHAGSSSKSREKIAACWHCALMTSSSGPPDARPVVGRTAVSAELGRGSRRIHGIEISGRRILGSNEIAYLTASYKTTFSSAEDSTPRQAFGSHLWILEKRADVWALALVSWSVWGHAAISGTRQPPPSASAGSTS